MNKTQGWVWACLLLLPISLAWGAPRCRPPEDRALVIGYTYKLDWFTTHRLKNSARLLGYKVKFRDLRKTVDQQEALRLVDGVIVPGGADISPDYYAKDTLPATVLATIEQFRHHYNSSREGERRDPFEYGLYQTYYSSPEFSNLPLLGICRGMQMMAVAKGIPLVLDIKAELGINNRYNRFDRFKVIDVQSRLGKLFQSGSALGFKYHHQNPRLDYLQTYASRHPDVRVTATSWSNRLVEAIELTDRPALGVQFHPEKSFPAVKHRIFKWLLTQSCQRSREGVRP